jgi:hypothetical protein
MESTLTIGTAGFSVSAGKTATVKIKLNAAGRAQLGVGHGRLTASLAIVEQEGSTQTKTVHLIQQKAHGKAKK